MNKEEKEMQRNVLKALADLNKPAGLPESAYWSEGLALWIYQIVELAVRNAASEMLKDYAISTMRCDPPWEVPDE